MMTAERYAQLTAWWRVHPRALGALVRANSALTALGWVAYPLLLVMAALLQPGLLVRLIVVPLVGFALCTLLRRAIDEARPYEQLAIEPLIAKSTHGKSFPSRHVFSMTTIAASWLVLCVPVGVVLLVASAFMAWVRVLGGVHFAHDVAAGALLALACALIGYVLVPW